MTQSADKLMIDALTKERDAALEQNTALDARCAKLEAAGKLALDAMSRGYMGRNHASYCSAIDALRQVGVQ